MNMELETQRLLLRPFTPGDLDDLQEILGDARAMEFLEPPYRRERTADFLQHFCIARRGALAAERKGTGKVVGYLLFCPQGEGVYELGWVFRPDCWRQGLAFEASSALLQYAFSRLDARRVFAETADPVRATGLLRKLGMEPCGSEDGGKLCTYELTENRYRRCFKWNL